MVVRRTIATSRYVLAGIITLFIFFAGLSFGMGWDTVRVQSLTRAGQFQELDTRSIQLQHLVLAGMANTTSACRLLGQTIEDSVRSLHASLERLDRFESQAKFSGDEYRMLQRRYALDNIQYWYLARRARDQCDLDRVTVLYFFSGGHCDTCPDQGTLLTYFKRLLGEHLLVFPLDIDLQDDEHMIGLLRASYGIERYPALVIEDQAFQDGVVPRDDLGRLICGRFRDAPEECAEFLTTP